MPRADACRNCSWEVVVGIRISIMKEKRCDETAMRAKGARKFCVLSFSRGGAAAFRKGQKTSPRFLLLMDTAAEGDRVESGSLCISSASGPACHSVSRSDDRLCARAVGVFCVGRAPV